MNFAQTPWYKKPVFVGLAFLYLFVEAPEWLIQFHSSHNTLIHKIISFITRR